MQSNTARTPVLFNSAAGATLINHDLFVQLFCQHRFYLLFASLTQMCHPPKTMQGKLHFLVVGRDLLMFGPVLPNIPHETLSFASFGWDEDSKLCSQDGSSIYGK